MNFDIIQSRLSEFKPENAQEEFNALREIAQEICLAALSQSGFFEKAAFQGGTALRILYGLPRFSEDLDFILKDPDLDFHWEEILQLLNKEFLAFGIDFATKDRSKADAVIKQAFVKKDSFGKELVLNFIQENRGAQKIKIKLEVDTNPPAHSNFEEKFLEFPFTYAVLAQDLPSMFASKCHALLCRPYVKGRDWFDFVWYMRKKVTPNFAHLEAALRQVGPYRDEGMKHNNRWLRQALEKKVRALDFKVVKADVQRFLRPLEQKSLLVWDKEYFLDLVGKL